MSFYKDRIDNSKILKKLNLKKNDYFLLTCHRQENVDAKLKLKDLVMLINLISSFKNKKIVWPLHPRTKIRLKKHNFKLLKNIIIIDPIDFFDFSNLEKNSECIITDSGTVQEEASILKKPNLIIRDTTERPETIEAGSSIIVGSSKKNIKKQIEIALDLNSFSQGIPEYQYANVSNKIIKILFSNYEFD